MAKAQSAGRTGVGNDPATVPTGSPTGAPLPASPATTSWTIASTATTLPRTRSAVEDRRVVSGMPSFSGCATPPGQSASPERASPDGLIVLGRLLQQQDVEAPGRDDHPHHDHRQEVGEVPEQPGVYRARGQRPH